MQGTRVIISLNNYNPSSFPHCSCEATTRGHLRLWGRPWKACALWLNFSSNLRMLRSEGGIYLTWKHAASVVNLVGLVTSTSKLSCLPGPNFLNLCPPNATSHQCSLNHLLHPATWWHQAVQQSQRPAPGSLGCFEYKLSPCPQDLVCRKQMSQTMTTQHLQASGTHLLKEKRNSLVPLSTWGHTLPEGLCECRWFAKGCPSMVNFWGERTEKASVLMASFSNKEALLEQRQLHPPFWKAKVSWGRSVGPSHLLIQKLSDFLSTHLPNPCNQNSFQS